MRFFIVISRRSLVIFRTSYKPIIYNQLFRLTLNKKITACQMNENQFGKPFQ